MNLFPIALAEGEKITAKIEELKHTIKFQSKKASCLGTAIGNVETGEDNLRQNLTMGINFLVSLMKKGWQNVGTLHIKTSMGKSYRIFGWLYTSFKSLYTFIKDYCIIETKEGCHSHQYGYIIFCADEERFIFVFGGYTIGITFTSFIILAPRLRRFYFDCSRWLEVSTDLLIAFWDGRIGIEGLGGNLKLGSPCGRGGSFTEGRFD